MCTPRAHICGPEGSSKPIDSLLGLPSPQSSNSRRRRPQMPQGFDENIDIACLNLSKAFTAVAFQSIDTVLEDMS